MITTKHTHIKVNDTEYNIYEEKDKSVTISCPTDGNEVHITQEALSQFVTVLQNIERSQDHYDW